MYRNVLEEVVREKKPYFRTITAKTSNHSFKLLYQPELCLTPDEITIAQAEFVSDTLANTEHLRNIIELGVGSGVFLSCILLNSNSEDIHVRGIDIDANALEIAKFNLKGVADVKGFSQRNYSLSEGNWLKYETPLACGTDLIYANPPYLPIGADIRSEFVGNPEHALFAEDNGLEHYRTIIEQARLFLRIGGYLFLRTSNKPDRIESVKNLINTLMPNSLVRFLEQQSGERRGAAFLIKILPSES